MSGARIRQVLRSLIYPGLDLHTRNRASLRRYWRTGPRKVLDAGCGNGYLSYLAYESGASVVALNFDAEQVRKARELLIEYRGANPDRLSIEVANLYDLGSERRRFDEIICFEVLEHLRDDVRVLGYFHQLLNEGGTLHLCCPNRLHERHQREVLDLEELGGHVRPGYTEDEYRRMLEPLGFEISRVVGIGPRSLYLADEVLRRVRNALGDLVSLPLFAVLIPVVWMAPFNPREPFSLYVTATKRRPVARPS